MDRAGLGETNFVAWPLIYEHICIWMELLLAGTNDTGMDVDGSNVDWTSFSGTDCWWVAFSVLFTWKVLQGRTFKTFHSIQFYSTQVNAILLMSILHYT